MDGKLIVSNRSALLSKYGRSGVARIEAAVRRLVAADAKRGVRTRLVFLDDGRALRAAGGAAVTDPLDPRENTAAIDAVHRKIEPEYLMILGAPDVVPHQDLKNPIFDGTDDPDRWAYGDLPYACDAPYARDIARFRGPTRVVGRLPDLTAAKSPSYLLALLKTAASYKPRDVAEYAAYLGLSAYAWRKSTALSLFNVFGNSDMMLLSPPSGLLRARRLLAPLAHFINCHGSLADPSFYGEKGRSQPYALTSDSIRERIRPGTVAAVECCFGAEMYDSQTLALPLPICQHYLRQGAYGYFGSSTIAYGPAEGNGAADLITQHFLQAILEGASLGRAALVARQRFVQQTAELDPVDLKTLGQFSLLGDPSIHAAKVPNATDLPVGIAPAEAIREDRAERRAKLVAQGDFLERTKPTASKRAKPAARSKTVRAALANIAQQAHIGGAQAFARFDVAVPAATRARSHGKTGSLASHYFVAVARGGAAGQERLVAAVAREVKGRIVGYRIYQER